MENHFKSRSSVMSLITNGRMWHLLNPWHISLNLNEGIINVKKRNWYLIGHDVRSYSIRYVREVSINTHLFGADMEIIFFEGRVSVPSLPKRDAEKIKTLLFEKNKNFQQGSGSVVFH